MKSLALTLSLLAILPWTPAAYAQQCAPQMASRTYPGSSWEVAYDAEQGWSEEGLDRAFSLAERSFYAAGMLVYRGRIIRKFGDIARPFDAGAVQPSLLSPLVGHLVADGQLRLDASLGQLAIRERPPLTPQEEAVTVQQLLTSTSGVRRPSPAMDAADRRNLPDRSQRPGERFWFSRWGFDVLAAIIEQHARESVFSQFDRQVARPIGMMDYSPRRVSYRIEERLSLIPAPQFELSTRDRARFGLFYLRQGCWAGRQLLPPDWVKISTSGLVPTSSSARFGYLWWSLDDPGPDGARVVFAGGDGEQMIALIPSLDAVLVLTSDVNAPAWLNWSRRQVGLLPKAGVERAILGQVLRSAPRARPSSSAPAVN